MGGSFKNKYYNYYLNIRVFRDMTMGAAIIFVFSIIIYIMNSAFLIKFIKYAIIPAFLISIILQLYLLCQIPKQVMIDDENIIVRMPILCKDYEIRTEKIMDLKINFDVKAGKYDNRPALYSLELTLKDGIKKIENIDKKTVQKLKKVIGVHNL